MSTDWRGFASCLGMEPDLFIGPFCERPDRRDRREAEAKAVCAECIVRTDCLDWALPRPLDGVFGGLNEDERRMLAAFEGIPRLCSSWRHVMPEGAAECRPCRAQAKLEAERRRAEARRLREVAAA